MKLVSVRLRQKGVRFFLNGKPVFLKGISIHEEAPFRSGRICSEEEDLTLLNWAKRIGLQLCETGALSLITKRWFVWLKRWD